jgi:hypothetical protein
MAVGPTGTEFTIDQRWFAGDQGIMRALVISNNTAGAQVINWAGFQNTTTIVTIRTTQEGSFTMRYNDGAPKTVTSFIPWVDITSASGLDNIRNNLGGFYRLANDINLTSTWTPIGGESAPFTGVFNGNNKTITGLNITSGTRVGLFGSVSGEVKDFKISGSVTGSNRVGMVAGQVTASAIIRNVEVLDGSTVSGGEYTGGIVGNANIAGNADALGATFTNLINRANVTATGDYTGGIVGFARNGIITGCKNFGTITSTATARAGGRSNASGGHGRVILGGATVGGIVGYYMASSANITLTNLENSGAVTGANTSAAGGIIGLFHATVIFQNPLSAASFTTRLTNSTNSGAIEGNLVGGIVGRGYGDASSVDGTMGMHKIRIEGCTNTGARTGIGTLPSTNNNIVGTDNNIDVVNPDAVTIV